MFDPKEVEQPTLNIGALLKEELLGRYTRKLDSSGSQAKDVV
jgi:hypothetical protein